MLSKTKLSDVFKYLLVSMALVMFSCQEDSIEPPAVVTEQSSDDLRSQLSPISSQELPEAVQEQLDLTRQNLENYMSEELQIVDIKVLGSIPTAEVAALSHKAVTNDENFIAFGNIMDPASVNIAKMKDMYSEKEATATRISIKELAAEEIKAGNNVLEITWKSGNETFKTECFYNDEGIIWDNVLTGLIMMDPKGEIEETEKVKSSTQARVSSSWYKQWWTANWLWGSKRGEMGYKITVYYSGSTVSNTDVSDWGYISLGKARSYSRIVKNSGSYGKCQYALGLCTPTGSLSFSTTYFKVSFSGLGSNVIANGYKSKYP